MTVLDFMKELNQFCNFLSRERTGKASNSEMKRWIAKRSVLINGEHVEWDEIIDFNMDSVVLFPKGRQITIL